MADISYTITRKSLAAKKRAAIKTIKAQAKEKIRQVKMEYAVNPDLNKNREVEKQRKKELRSQKINAMVSYNERQPRPYSVGEEIFNSLMHGIGAGLSVAAIVLLAVRVWLNYPEPKAMAISAFSVFGSCLLVMFVFSTLNHALASLSAKKVFNVLTRDSVFLLMASVYTVFAIVLSPHPFEIIVPVWIVAGVAVSLYSVLGRHLQGFSLLVVFVSGWILAGVCGFSDGFGGNQAPALSRVFLVVSALVLSPSCVFALMRNSRWAHCVFHTLTLAGCVTLFFSVFFLV